MAEQLFLIEIGDGVTIASDVMFLTHDYSIHNVLGSSTLFGRISIGDNCFIGARTIILPGVSVCNNVIVAAGSVVTKSVDKPYSIIGGNPAKEIGTWDKYRLKYEHNAISYDGSKEDLMNKIKSNGKLIEK